MGYSYNEYYEKYRDDDFKEKLNYYKSKGVTVDDDIWTEFDNRGSEAAYATKQKDSCDEQIEKIRDEDQIGKMTEELRMMIPKIAKLKKEKDNFLPFTQKRKDIENQIKAEHQTYQDKNKRRHKLKDDFKKIKEKSSKFEEQINTCESTRKNIKTSVNNQIKRLNMIESTLEFIDGLDLNQASLNNPESLNAINELKKSLKEAQKIELHPSDSKIENLKQKLNNCLNLKVISDNTKKITKKSQEKEEKCNKDIEAKKSFDLNETEKSTKNKDDDSER